MKKILSLVLVIALVLGSFSFAFAATPTDVVGEDYEEAVEVLMALGVVNGYPDGTYKPERVVTRAEMAKLLVEALGYGQLAGGTAPYSDTAGHWAAGSIGLASGIGLVQGYPDGTFKPDATVSFDEAVTMILRALGYTDESLRGAWPTNYKIKAIDLGLYDDTSAQTGGADRGNVAIMLFNALGLKLVEIIDGVATPVTTGSLLLIDKVGTKVEEVEISYADIYDEDDALDTVIDLEPYLYHTITYYENKDGDIAYVSEVHTDEYVGLVVDSDTNEITVEDADEDEEIFDITSAAAFFYNGLESNDDIDELDTDKTVEIKVVYDDNDVVQGVVVWQSKVWMIGNEYTDRRPTQIDGIKLPVDSDDDLDLDELTIEGDATSLEDIAEDDIVHIYSSDGTNARTNTPEKLKLVVVRDTYTGKLTEVDGDTYVVGGVEFEKSVYSGSTLADLVVGNLGEVLDLNLDKNGDIFKAVLSDEDAPAAEGYAVYVSNATGALDADDFYPDDLTIDKAPRIKLFTSEGDLVVYNVYTGDIDLEAATTAAAIADVSLGDIDLSIDQLDEEGIISITGIGTSDKGSIVEFELNSDGEITSLVFPVDTTDYVTGDIDDDAMTIKSFDIKANTIVFNIEGDEADWEVVDSVYAVDATGGDLVYDEFDIVAMTAIAGLQPDETYGIVTKVVAYYDGSDSVQKVTALVNGEEVIYVTTESDSVDSVDDIEKVVSFTFDGDRLDYVTDDVDVVTGGALQITQVDSVRVRVATEGLFTFADDVAVYVEDDGDFTAETVSYLRVDDYVTLYLDNYGDVIVVLFNIDQAQYDN